MNMSVVRPDVEAFLTYLKSLPGPVISDIPIQDARAMAMAQQEALDVPVGRLSLNQEFLCETPSGPIPLRLFDARSSRASGPIMVFVHGGGFWNGNAAYYAPFCAEAARVLDIPVIAIDYRLAPEHPFPAAVVDCEFVVRWIASNPTVIGRAATGLVLCGDSAGANLAIVTAMSLRDQVADTPVIAQLLFYPCTDLSKSYPSQEQFADGYLLTMDLVRYAYRLYAPDVLDWRASPLLGSPTGTPPTIVVTASLDPLRDEGRAYAGALARAGVPVFYREAIGNIHGFINLSRAIPSSTRDITDALSGLKFFLSSVIVGTLR